MKATKLTHYKRTKVGLHRPDDDLWEYDYYVKKKGDPATNGKGHRVVEEQGKKFVAVPGRPIWKRTRVQEEEVNEERDLQPENMRLDDQHMYQVCDELSSRLLYDVAIGEFDDLPAIGADKAEESKPAAAAPPLKDSEEGSQEAGLRHMFAIAPVCDAARSAGAPPARSAGVQPANVAPESSTPK